MTYLFDESGVETSKPVEIYFFDSLRDVHYFPKTIARSTSFDRDVVFGGFTYTARAIRRSAAPVVNAQTNTPEMTIEVERTDPIVAFYLSAAPPPQGFTCTITRIQTTSGQTQQIFTGVINDMRVNGNTVSVTIAQVTDDFLATQIPQLRVSKKCGHTLYDSMCRLARAANTVTTTITGVSGRTITVASFGAFAAGDFADGEALHTPTGERRLIVRAYAPLSIDLDLPLPYAVSTHPIVLYRGCDRLVQTCRDRFANVVNFGGMPHVKTTNTPTLGSAAALPK